MRYFKKIKGERLYLSPINLEDFPIYTKWVNDSEVALNLGMYNRMLSLTNEKSLLENMVKDGNNYAIVLNDGDELIGNIGFNEVNHLHRTGTIGIFIGEDAHRGKGYGTEAMRLLVEYGFKTLNLHNIMLNVHSTNLRAIASYKKVGFTEFGRRKEARFIDGKYIDEIEMEILSTDFFNK